MRLVLLAVVLVAVTVVADNGLTSSLIETVDAWRSRIKQEQTTDNQDTMEETSGFNVKAQEIQSKIDSHTEESATAEAMSQFFSHKLLALPKQTRDAGRLEETSKVLLGEIGRRCSPAKKQAIADAVSVRRKFSNDLVSFANTVRLQQGWGGQHNHSWSRVAHSLGAISALMAEEEEKAQQEVVESRRWCSDVSGSVSAVVSQIEESLTSLIGAADDTRLRVVKNEAKQQNLTATSEQLSHDLSNVKNDLDLISSGSRDREAARKIEIKAIDKIRGLLMSLESIQGIQQLANNNNNEVMGGTGRTKRTASRTCSELKKFDPDAPDGVYWLHFGKGSQSAVQAFCDMTTEGGGWTLVTKVIGGAVEGIKKPKNDTNSVVFPLWIQAERAQNTLSSGYEFFSSRKNQEWLKTVELLAPSSPHNTEHKQVPVINQAIRVALGSNSLDDIASIATESGSVCASLDSPVSVYSSRSNLLPGSSHVIPQHPISGSVDFFAGQTRKITSKRANCTGFGFSTLTNQQADMCGASLDQCVTKEVICDTHGLQVLSPAKVPSSLGSGQLISSLFEQSCVFSCQAPLPEGFGELAVFAVRAAACPSDSFGTECSGNGQCLDGICECSFGYEGESCEISVCVNGCDHGFCQKGICQCTTGFMGRACDQKTVCQALHSELVHLDVDNEFMSGSVHCSGNQYGDQCTYECEDDFVLSSPTAPILRYFGESAIIPADSCNEPINTIQASQNQCVEFKTGRYVKISSPNAAGGVEVKWYTDQNCGDLFAHSSLQCGAECQPMKGERVSVTCPKPTSTTLTCESSGNWTGSAPTCIRSNCQEIANPDHGSATCTGNEDKDVCHVTCNLGFALSKSPGGDLLAVCRSGRWEANGFPLSPTTMTCSKRDCLTPQAPENGKFSCAPDTKYGAVCSVVCDEGFLPEGVMEVVCGSDGMWGDIDEVVCRQTTE